MVWVAYQTHGDRAVIVVPAWILRTFLLVLALPFMALGRAAGRGTGVPGFLHRSWTAEPDPERPRILSRKVDPMKLPNERLSQERWHLFDRDWERLYAIGVISMAGGGKDETLIGPAFCHELVRGSSDVVVMDPKLEQLKTAREAGHLPKGADLYVSYTYAAGSSQSASRGARYITRRPEEREEGKEPTRESTWREIEHTGDKERFVEEANRRRDEKRESAREGARTSRETAAPGPPSTSTSSSRPRTTSA